MTEWESFCATVRTIYLPRLEDLCQQRHLPIEIAESVLNDTLARLQVAVPDPPRTTWKYMFDRLSVELPRALERSPYAYWWPWSELWT